MCSTTNINKPKFTLKSFYNKNKENTYIVVLQQSSKKRYLQTKRKQQAYEEKTVCIFNRINYSALRHRREKCAKTKRQKHTKAHAFIHKKHVLTRQNTALFTPKDKVRHCNRCFIKTGNTSQRQISFKPTSVDRLFFSIRS